MLENRIHTEYDDKLMEKILRFLKETHHSKQAVNLRMADPYDDVRVIGLIERFDPSEKRFMVDGEWFSAYSIQEMRFERVYR